jgi:hypothetical protein
MVAFLPKFSQGSIQYQLDAIPAELSGCNRQSVTGRGSEPGLQHLPEMEGPGIHCDPCLPVKPEETFQHFDPDRLGNKCQVP